MYGSNFWSVTVKPRETSSRPIDAAAIPLPSAETTPPVTKMKRVVGRAVFSKDLLGMRRPAERVYPAKPGRPVHDGRDRAELPEDGDRSHEPERDRLARGGEREDQPQPGHRADRIRPGIAEHP